MPGKVGVKIKAGRNLPVMDRSSDTTDAYVEIKLGNVTHKTDVCRKSLNPQWNTDWFRFEVDDAELQDEPLQIRLMDYDTYSANDAIGKVNISLNTLCLETSGQTTHGKGTVLSGWIPVFDTMHGIRGEVNVIVKVDLFSDVNKFRQSSCGIPFFHSQCIPFGYRAQVIHGFVEELVVNDDPEYQWIDKIRTPRASNEARQVVFLKLSGQVQRKMGLKAINMGANAVIGYTQCFDLEGDVGVVARGIGTAVTLIKDTSSGGTQPATTDNALIEEQQFKYLQFLNGSTTGLNNIQPEYKLHISKSSSATLFDLKRSNSVNDDSDLMLDLIRQEDERGEKPVKNLKHHVKRFTHSSRNIFNEKYAAFMRKLGDSSDSKSPENTSRSLSSLFTSSGAIYIKEELAGSGSASSTRSSRYEVRKKSFKAKNKIAGAQPIQRQSFKKTAHPIVRSVSDDSAMKHTSCSNIDNPSVAPNVSDIAEYHDSTRSSPNICSEGQQAATLKALKEVSHKLADCDESGYINDYHQFGKFSTHEPHLRKNFNDERSHHQFGEFSTHEPHLLKNFNDESGTLPSCSSNTMSLNMSDSSSSEDSKIEENDEERAKVENFLKICHIHDDDDEQLDENWMKPGQTIDDSLPDLIEHHSLLHDIKAFSHHVQELMHTPKKTGTATANLKRTIVGESVSSKPLRRSPPKSLLLPLKSYLSNEHKSYYSSQPEISTECDAAAGLASSLALPLTQLMHSRSLINLTKAANVAIPINLNITKDDMFCDNSPTIIPTTVEDLAPCSTPPLPQFPVLRVCPSTPTPSESGSPSDLKGILRIPEASICSKIYHQRTRNSNPKNSAHVANPQSNKNNNICISRQIQPNIHYLKTNTNTNHSNKNSSLLAPSLFCIQNRHLRSLNENSIAPNVAGPAIMDSPSMKRFASPASAAIAASAAAGSGGSGGGITNATGPVLGSRSKLSPSPSKMGLTTAAATANTSQSDSISSTTTSTATTVLPKEMNEMCRRSSDSDLSVTPKGNSLCVASERLVAATAMMRLSQPIVGKNTNTDGIDMLEYPFLTMTKYPSGFILHLGATVAARSVKLLERVPNPDEPEVRDSWWTELRMEIRSHARALGCNVVLGYSESTTISDDVCVLSATGTAAVINMAYNRSVSQTDILTMTKPVAGSVIGVGVVAGGSVAGAMSASLEERDILKDARNGVANEAILAAAIATATTVKESISSSVGNSQSVTNSASKKSTMPSLSNVKHSCTVCHIPYNLTSVPFNVKMKKCAICRKGRVPDVLLVTLEVPEYLQVTGRGCFMQAQVVRAKKDLRSELNAKEISDGLPFLEYELHRVLINKLKAKGMNAIFGLKAQVAVGERMIALIATGTALFLSALPVPQVPKIVAGNSWTDKQKLNELQKKLQETFERNQEIYQLKCIDPDFVACGGGGLSGVDKQSDTDESDDEVIEIDLNCGNKDTCVLEVDDIEDLEIISLLMEAYPPEGFHVVNTQMVPGMVDMEAVKNLQMFTQVWRAKLDVGQNISGFPKHFQRLLQTIYFKLRTMIPCAICDLRFRLDLPESDQIQLLVTGMALGLADANKFKYRRKPGTINGSTSASTLSYGLTNDENINVNINQTQDINGSGDTTTMQGNKRTLQDEDYIFPLDEDQMVETPTPTSNLPPYGMHSFKVRKTSPTRASTTKSNTGILRNRYFPLRDRYGVDITPLSFIPGGRIDKYLGNLNFFFIRETTSIRENGGISGFVHGFITELLAVVRAHIAALGGNAMVSFNMTELILVDNQHKNQGQCLISIGGDAVFMSYYSADND